MHRKTDESCCPYGWIKLPLAVGICVLVGVLSAMSTATGLNGWYASLNRPFYAPPNAMFGPVWTLLFIGMGLCAGVIWRRSLNTPGVRSALGFFLLQLALNALWSPLFFAAHALGWALLEIILLWIAIGLTIRAFARVSRPAALWLLPYWAWVTFATALNAGFWWLNR